MIEGLKYHFTSAELADHMTKRAMYHEQRAEEKSKALPEMRAALEKIKSHTPVEASIANMIKNSSQYHVGNPDEDLERDIRDHKNKALVFKTLASHVVKNETYVLSESDLQRIEILKV